MQKEADSKPAEKFDEGIDPTLCDYRRLCKSCTLYLVLLIIAFIMIMGISGACFIFIGVWKEIISTHYPINLTADPVKMLYSDRIDVSKGIDVTKSNKSKECVICHLSFDIL